MEVEIENARAAWNWAAGRGEAARLGRALDGLCHFYEWRVRYREGEAACRLAAGRLISTEQPLTSASVARQRLVARLLVWQGTFTYLRGHIDLACPLLRRGLALLEELEGKGHDARSDRAHALLQIAEATLDVDRQATKRYCEGSLALYRAVGDRWGTAKVLALLGATRRRLGLYGTETSQRRYERARAQAEESIALAREVDFKWTLGSSLSRWYQDVAGRHMAALAAALPPDVAAAALERGRELDLGAAMAAQLAELERSESAYFIQ